MSHIYYFAYGSNLSVRRLQQRVPSAEFVRSAYLLEHRLCFHKRNRDGSAKADCLHTGDQRETLWGAVFTMLAAEKPALDAAEGLGAGYELKEVEVLFPDGGSLQAMTYYATDIDTSLKPYGWYLNHILTGAAEARLPADYLARLQLVEYLQDPDAERDRRERHIYDN